MSIPPFSLIDLQIAIIMPTIIIETTIDAIVATNGTIFFFLHDPM